MLDKKSKMIVKTRSGSRVLSADLGSGIDISIHLDFHGAQPSAFGASPAEATPYTLGKYVLATRSGGSCNVDVVHLTPHCNGTHTECIGHIIDDRVAVSTVLSPGLSTALLLTVEPMLAEDCSEQYDPALDPVDRVITAGQLAECLPPKAATQSLVIRTIPNSLAKKTRDYDIQPGPFFTTEAMDLIASSSIRHLVVDFASVDRANDEGRMSNHRRFWRDDDRRTITEFAFVPDNVADGAYLLDLQIAPFVLDAAPSRPILFPLTDAD